MTEEPLSEKTNEVTLTNKEVKPNYVPSRIQGMPTIAADFGKVLINSTSHVCTFSFFRQHPIAKYGEQGMNLDSIEEEECMEIKMTMEAAFAISLYMNEVLKHIRQNPDKQFTYFGPGSITYEQIKETK